MKRSRIFYFGIIILVIVLGLLSRRISGIPLFLGDILWAVMMFFIIRFLFIESSVRLVALVSLVLCYLVEISQLYQADWINAIRHTLPGRLILGQGFLWTDLLAYTAGIIVAVLSEAFLSKKSGLVPIEKI